MTWGKYATVEDRFLAKVYHEPNTGCWLWGAGASGQFGYGTFKTPDGKATPAHRASYELFCGPIPEGLFVLHKCDVPECVNPDHLYTGTQLDNVTDRERRGRSADVRGEKNGAARLTEKQVREIREGWPEKPFRIFADRYDVTITSVWRAAHHITWRHI